MARLSEDANALFTRRALILGGAGVAGFGALAARLYKLQIIEADRYRGLSEQNQFNYQLLPPGRGHLLDRHGLPLAQNTDNFRLLLDPELVPDIDAMLRTLGAIVPLPDNIGARLKKAIRRRTRYASVVLLDNLDWHHFAAANLHLPTLPGVRPEVGELRIYPGGAATAHAVGYVGLVPQDRQTTDPLLHYPGFRIGRSGAEKAFDRRLRGQAGALKVEVNALGRVIRTLPDPATAAKAGQDITLTLDRRIQSFAAQRLEGLSAALCAIDIQTGAIPVLLSTPGFDPDQFARGISAHAYKALLADDHKPLFNKALGGTYPPASCFKPVVAMAALHHGVTDGRERIRCTGKITLGDRDFHCWLRRGHGPVNMLGAIGASCDVYFYEMARRLGIERIHDAALKMGLGQMFDLGIGGGNAALVPNQAWKQARFGRKWAQGETLITGIGQGYLSATPIQLAVMTARLASGRKVVPTLLAPPDTASPEQPLFESIGLAADSLGPVRSGMIAVCETPWGTAHRLGGLGIEGVQMAGKTGTGQVRRISKKERDKRVRKNAELPWALRDHALFVTFAPASAPRYAVAVVVEHGGGGSVAAAPPGRDILRQLLMQDAARLARSNGPQAQSTGEQPT